jgi:hypothetical protein
MIIVLLIVSTGCIAQRDTTIRKKYLDSVKNQLAAYTIGSYTYLNLYDRCENEKLAKDAKIASFDDIMFIKKKRNTRAIVYILVATFMSELVFCLNIKK